MQTATLKNTIISLIFLLFVSCDRYDFPESPYPKIETLPVITSQQAGTTLQATILKLGNLPATKHGFVWGPNENLSIYQSYKIEFTETPVVGDFTATIASGLAANTNYFVRAFIATDSYIVYGEAVAFKSP